ncbi:MAG: hypothetical protein O2819_03415 [Planctomycetota bacterium]|nr:hypothetical protein [Planctomycetota bacterium]MDA1106224.1 hypothetical protein [Planctomycetota bacterium]
MRFTISIAFLSVTLAALGCQYQPSAGLASGESQLPKDWFSLPNKDALQALSPSIRARLDAVAQLVEEERKNQLGLVDAEGRVIYTYSPALLAMMAEVNADCSRNFMASWTVVSGYISPEMDGLAQTWNGYAKNDVNIDNLNRRGLRDDWARIWLMDTPSSLTATPMGNLTGNP